MGADLSTTPVSMESSGVGLISCELLVYEDWPTFGRKPGTRGQDAQPPPAACFIATRIPWSCGEAMGQDTKHIMSGYG